MDEWVAALPALALPVAALAWLTLTPQRDILETHETRVRIWVGNTIAALILGLDALVLIRLWAEQSLWVVGAPWVRVSFWLLTAGFAAPLALTLAGLVAMPAFYRLSLGLRPLDPVVPADRILQEETTELAERIGLRHLLTLRRATRRAGTFPFILGFPGRRRAILSIPWFFEAEPALQDAARRRFALLHELAHLRNGDASFMSWALLFLRVFRLWLPGLLLIILFARGPSDSEALPWARVSLLPLVVSGVALHLLVLSVSRQREFLADARAFLCLNPTERASLLAPFGPTDRPPSSPRPRRWRRILSLLDLRSLAYSSPLSAGHRADEPCWRHLIAIHPAPAEREAALHSAAYVSQRQMTLSREATTWVGVGAFLFSTLFPQLLSFILLRDRLTPFQSNLLLTCWGLAGMFYLIFACCLPLRNAIVPTTSARTAVRAVMRRAVWLLPGFVLAVLLSAFSFWANLYLFSGLIGGLREAAGLGRALSIVLSQLLSILGFFSQLSLIYPIAAGLCLLLMAWLTANLQTSPIPAEITPGLGLWVGAVAVAAAAGYFALAICIFHVGFLAITIVFLTAVGFGTLSLLRKVSGSFAPEEQYLVFYALGETAWGWRREFGSARAYFLFATLVMAPVVLAVIIWLPSGLTLFLLKALASRWPALQVILTSDDPDIVALVLGLLLALVIWRESQLRWGGAEARDIGFVRRVARFCRAEEALGQRLLPPPGAIISPALTPASLAKTLWPPHRLSQRYIRHLTQVWQRFHPQVPMPHEVVAFALAAQNPGGGFGLWPGGFSRLEATHDALCTLQCWARSPDHAHGWLEDVDTASHIAWVASCSDPDSSTGSGHRGGYRSPEHPHSTLADTAAALQALALLGGLETADRKRCSHWALQEWRRGRRGFAATRHLVTILRLLGALEPVVLEIEETWLRFHAPLAQSLRPDKQIAQLANYLTLVRNLYDDPEMRDRWTGGLAERVREGWAALTRPHHSEPEVRR
jgi:hypothetical protein